MATLSMVHAHYFNVTQAYTDISSTLSPIFFLNITILSETTKYRYHSISKTVIKLCETRTFYQKYYDNSHH